MQKYTFYVGAGYTRSGKPMDGPSGTTFEQIETLLISWCGGFTKVIGDGAYTSNKQGLIREPVVIYSLFVDSATEGLQTKMIKLARAIATLADQESVLIENRGYGELVFSDPR